VKTFPKEIKQLVNLSPACGGLTERLRRSEAVVFVSIHYATIVMGKKNNNNSVLWMNFLCFSFLFFSFFFLNSN